MNSITTGLISAAGFVVFAVVAQAQLNRNDTEQIEAVPPPVVLTDGDLLGATGYPPIDRVLYPIQSQPGYFYFYDAVNRPFGLTPEPVWVAAFPGINSRANAEVRMFGVPGQSVKEMHYHARFYEAYMQQERARQGQAAAGGKAAPDETTSESASPKDSGKAAAGAPKSSGGSQAAR